MLHTSHKAFEEKGKTEQLNAALKSENKNLKEKLGSTKIDLTFATQVKWSFFGGLMLLVSFLFGYYWFENFGLIEFTIQNIVFLFVTSMAAAYGVLYVLDLLFKFGP